MTDQPDNKWMSRKFLMCSVVLGIATVFRYFDLIGQSDWTNISITCVGAYNVSNAIARR